MQLCLTLCPILLFTTMDQDLRNLDHNSQLGDTGTVHDRMPVILDPSSYDLWLGPGMQNVAAISELLKPFHALVSSEHPAQSCGELSPDYANVQY